MSFCSGRGMAFSKIQILRGAIWQGIWQLALREAVQKVQRIRGTGGAAVLPRNCLRDPGTMFTPGHPEEWHKETPERTPVPRDSAGTEVGNP